jgi:hypothetical protein
MDARYRAIWARSTQQVVDKLWDKRLGAMCGGVLQDARNSFRRSVHHDTLVGYGDAGLATSAAALQNAPGCVFLGSSLRGRKGCTAGRCCSCLLSMPVPFPVFRQVPGKRCSAFLSEVMLQLQCKASECIQVSRWTLKALSPDHIIPVERKRDRHV